MSGWASSRSLIEFLHRQRPPPEPPPPRWRRSISTTALSPFALSVYVYDLDCFFYHCISRWRVVLSSVFSLSSTGSTLDGGRTIKSTATGSGLDDDSPNFWNLNDDSTI
ncbi:hypothetical protein ABFS83_05G079500 [Erythranthe nasuta]